VGIGRLTTSMPGFGNLGSSQGHNLGMSESISGGYGSGLSTHDSHGSFGGNTLGGSSSSGSLSSASRIMRTLAGSTSSGLDSISTAYTSPDLTTSASGKFASQDSSSATPTSTTPGANPADSGATPAGTTTLTPISALPTAEKEARLGWAKVAEADLDAFMCYASIVPEYCRLERTLIRVGQA
jgi:xylulokinase